MPPSIEIEIPEGAATVYLTPSETEENTFKLEFGFPVDDVEPGGGEATPAPSAEVQPGAEAGGGEPTPGSDPGNPDGGDPEPGPGGGEAEPGDDPKPDGDDQPTE